MTLYEYIIYSRGSGTVNALGETHGNIVAVSPFAGATTVLASVSGAPEMSSPSLTISAHDESVLIMWDDMRILVREAKEN
jgi:hypothetical protein